MAEKTLMTQLGELLATRISHINDNLAELEQRVTDIEGGGSSSGGSTEEGGETVDPNGTATYSRYITTADGGQRALTITLSTSEYLWSGRSYNLEAFIGDILYDKYNTYSQSYTTDEKEVDGSTRYVIYGTDGYDAVLAAFQDCVRNPIVPSELNVANGFPVAWTSIDTEDITGKGVDGYGKYQVAVAFDSDVSESLFLKRYVRYLIVNLTDEEFANLITLWKQKITEYVTSKWDINFSLSTTNTSVTA